MLTWSCLPGHAYLVMLTGHAYLVMLTGFLVKFFSVNQQYQQKSA